MKIFNETELGKVFIYPFHWVNEAVTAGDGDPAALEQMIQEEVFAQLVRLSEQPERYNH